MGKKIDYDITMGTSKTVDGVDVNLISLSNMPAVPSGEISLNSQAITSAGNIDGADISGLPTCTVSLYSATKADGKFYPNTDNPTNTTRLNYDGYFYATKVYNPVFSDIVDMFGEDVVDEYLCPAEIEFGAVYVLDVTARRIVAIRAGKHRACRAAMGIASDTAAHVIGSGALPFAVAGFVLAIVDKKYRSGTLLVNDTHGYLTKARFYERSRAIAKYVGPERQIEWNGIPVNGRHWVKVI